MSSQPSSNGDSYNTSMERDPKAPSLTKEEKEKLYHLDWIHRNDVNRAKTWCLVAATILVGLVLFGIFFPETVAERPIYFGIGCLYGLIQFLSEYRKYWLNKTMYRNFLKKHPEVKSAQEP